MNHFYVQDAGSFPWSHDSKLGSRLVLYQHLSYTLQDLKPLSQNAALCVFNTEGFFFFPLRKISSLSIKFPKTEHLMNFATQLIAFAPFKR